jgi:hypothetical protein
MDVLRLNGDAQLLVIAALVCALVLGGGFIFLILKFAQRRK